MNKVGVIMSDTRSFNKTTDAYYKWCALATNKSCKHWGFDFTFYNVVSKKYPPYGCYDPRFELQHRHPAWAKILAAYEHLTTNDIDYLVYLDTDAFLTNAESIINIVKGDITFGCDAPYNPVSPCTGFFVLKNTTRSLEFLEYWYKTSDESYNRLHPWDQGALRKIVADNIFEISVETQYQYFVDPHITTTYSKSLRHLHSPKKKGTWDIFIKEYYSFEELEKEYDSLCFKLLDTDKYKTMEKW